MTPSAPERGRSRVHSLTSLRFFAAAAVVVHHTMGPDGTPLVDLGFLGVTFFFVLSGFVLTWTDATRHGSLIFFRNRLARLYPLHLVLLIVAVVAPMGGRESLLALVQQLTLTQAWTSSAAHSFNWVSWSISSEWLFYLLFPAALISLRKVSAARWLVGVTIAAWIVQSCIALALILGDADLLWSYNFPPFRFFEFLVGICLGLLAGRGWQPQRLLAAAMLGVSGVGLTSVLVLDLVHPVPRALSSAAVVPVVVVVIWAAVAREVRGSAGWLTRPWLVKLGDWSFALYMVHALVIRSIGEAAGRQVPGYLPWWTVGPVLLVSVALAALLSEGVERPAERWLRGVRVQTKQRREASDGPTPGASGWTPSDERASPTNPVEWRTRAG